MAGAVLVGLTGNGAVLVGLTGHVGVVSGRSSLPDADSVVESDGYDASDGQGLMSRLQWDGSSDISPTDSASSKASKEILFPGCYVYIYIYI